MELSHCIFTFVLGLYCGTLWGFIVGFVGRDCGIQNGNNVECNAIVPKPSPISLRNFGKKILGGTQFSTNGLRYLGSPAVWRDTEDSVKKAMIIFDPTKRNPRDGTVIGWHVYTTRGRRSQTAHLQVWRPAEKGDNVWILVGQTVFVARWVGHNYFPLYPKDRINVKAGDTVGIYFPKYNPVPWSATACGHENEHIFRYNPRNIKVWREFKFERSSSDWKPCREYSFNATIADAPELASGDLSQLKFADTRRFHGNFLPTLKPPVGGATKHQIDYFLLLSLGVCLAALGVI